MSEQKTVERTFRSTLCPECGQMAIASKYGHDEVMSGGEVERYPVAYDSHWCNTPGCKHNHHTGEPFGTGLRFST